MSHQLTDILYVRVPPALTAALNQAAADEYLPLATFALQVLSKAVREQRGRSRQHVEHNTLANAEAGAT